MNFGVRLPGPFRVGVNSRGRLNVGVALGPFSASTGIGQQRAARGREPFYPISLDGAVGELLALGWMVRGHDGRIAHLTKGWQAVQVETVKGGVTWRPVTSTRKVLAWTIALLALAVLCGLAA